MRVTKAEQGNVGFVCPEHESKPGKYKGRKPKEFIGKYVKLGFPIKGTNSREHMWVLVEKVVKGELQGTLDNDPTSDVGYECGDGVGFKVEEIEDVYIPNGNS